jgi:2-hydroxychromene-2-carboxylate isomerase
VCNYGCVPLSVTAFMDPGCPWAYSAGPAFATLRWRYGDGLRWRLVTIGLTEDAQEYVRRGYDPVRSAARNRTTFRRRFGMPFGSVPRPRVVATGRACRAIVAARLRHPGREWAVLRALQFAWFTTPAILDEDDAIAQAIAGVPGVDADAIIAALGDPEVEAAYQADRDEARTAAGGATEAQGKAANTDGKVRFTAPSLVFEREDGTRLEAGGFQPVEAYDVVIANLDPTLPRRPAAEDAREVLDRFPDGLTTQEVAAVMTPHLGEVDRAAVETALIEMVGAGEVGRLAVGDDAVWVPAAAIKGVTPIHEWGQVYGRVTPVT